MMGRYRKTVQLLKKHGAYRASIFDIVGMVVCIVFLCITPNPSLIYALLIFIMFLAWDINDVKQMELREILQKRLAIKEKKEEFLCKEMAQMEEIIAVYKTIVDGRKENPIKSNRIVSNRTFAVRLCSFLKSVKANDQAGCEEKNYLLMTAERLLKWQLKTVRKGSDEYKYLERIGLMPEPSANTENGTNQGNDYKVSDL